MTKKAKVDMANVVMFSYREHDWSVEDEEGLQKELLRRAKKEQWVRLRGPEGKRAAQGCDVASLKELEERVRGTLVGEWQMPKEAVELPFMRLREMMAREGWRFRSGGFEAMEGNHNDTEICVVLEKE